MEPMVISLGGCGRAIRGRRPRGAASAIGPGPRLLIVIAILSVLHLTADAPGAVRIRSTKRRLPTGRPGNRSCPELPVRRLNRYTNLAVADSPHRTGSAHASSRRP